MLYKVSVELKEYPHLTALTPYIVFICADDETQAGERAGEVVRVFRDRTHAELTSSAVPLEYVLVSQTGIVAEG